MDKNEERAKTQDYIEGFTNGYNQAIRDFSPKFTGGLSRIKVDKAVEHKATGEAYSGIVLTDDNQ